MKRLMLAITLLTVGSLAACAIQATTLKGPTVSNPATVSPVAPVVRSPTRTQTTSSHAVEEAEVRDLVESFGKTLRMVSLLAPDAAQEVKKHYSEFVSPALLEIWMKDVSQAPGRMVSSPWPDRIEITTLSNEGSDKHTINGFVVEVTSTEVGSSDAAAKIPVRIVVQRDKGRWLITEYTEKR